MIISASYRTDIPAFYGGWFMRRLADGHCRTVNPWNGRAQAIDLSPEAVDGFVFWTRNLRPFFDSLPAVRTRAPFVVQYTVTGYPHALEASVVPAARAIADIRRVAAEYGPRAAVWRYDPVVVTDSPTPDSLMPDNLTPDWHRANFARLAADLAGAVDEAVVSFVQPYRKTRRNLDAAADRHGFAWRDPDEAEKRALAGDLAAIARRHGMALTLCTQPGLAVTGAMPARCIDADRLSDVAGRPIAAPVRGNRPGCLCHASRDVGAYDTCPHGCVYCYAVERPDRAKRRHAAHDPESPFLVPPRTLAHPSTGSG